MAGVASPEEIRESFTEKEPEAKERVARAAEIYRRVVENPEGVLPTTHRYLEQLARDELTSPVDIFTLATYMDNYPQLSVPTTADIRSKKVALPMDMIVTRCKQILDLAKKEKFDVVEMGKQFKETALKVIEKMSQAGPEGVEEVVFEAFKKTGPIPDSLMEDASEVWWGTDIPNVVTASTLKKIAQEKEPSLFEREITA